MKQGFVTLLVVGLTMMVLMFYLEPRHIEKAFNAVLGGEFEYFGINGLETHNNPNYNNNSESDLELRELIRDQLSHSKSDMTSQEQPSTASKCSYDVSRILSARIFIILLFGH